MPERFREGQRKIGCPIVWAVALTAVLGASPVEAINPDLLLTQLGHSAWRVQDGELPGTPTAIAQTKDGYIWIGTQAGLVRFDGVALVPVSAPPGQTPHSTQITALYGARDGGLWIGTASQLLQLKDGNFHLYPWPVGLFGTVREAPDGKIWATRSHTPDDLGPLCEARADDLACYGPKQGIPFKDAIPLAIEKSGAIWVAGTDKLARWRRGHSETFAPAALARSEGLEGFNAVVVAPDGTLWSGVINGGPGLGLQHFANGAWSPVISADIDTSTWEVTALLFDRDNTLWVGTANRGIYRVNGPKIDHFGVSDGLSADSVNGFCEDHEGNVWAVTTKGIDKFRPTQVVTFSSRQGLSADSVNAVLASKSGAIWVSNGALEKIKDGVVTSYRERDGVRRKLVTALFEDSQDRLWVGADDGVAVLDGKHFTPVRSPGRPIGAIMEFAQGPQSTVWAITALLPSRLVRMNAAEVLESVPPPAAARIVTLASGPDGALWMTVTGKAADCDLVRYATGRWETFPLHNPPYSGACSEVVVRDAHTVYVSGPLGIVGWHAGLLRKLTTESGLPCARAFSLAFDRHENLWAYLQCGIAVIESQQLAEWWNEPAKKLQVRLFDTSDGALPAPPDFHPRAAVGLDDKVWFANSTDLQFIDPKHPVRNPVVPPVQILALHGDRRNFPLGSPIVLPPLTRDVQIDFTALSFVVPQRVRFQFRLEGSDREWQTAGSPRQAVYTNLRPGTYRFSVRASNDDGLWNTRGDTLEFTIEPAFYQTWWFRLALGALLGLLGWGAYSYRLRNVGRQFAIRLDERVSERTRIARELHDSLLQGFQGLMFRLQAVRTLLPDRAKEAVQVLESALEMGDQAITEGREAVRDLRASEGAGTDLEESLKALGDELDFRQIPGTVSYRVLVQGKARATGPLVRDDVYRIAREAVRNAVQHARARTIEVELEYGSAMFRLRVRDDGVGVDPDVLKRGGRIGHWGVQGMRERAEALGGHLEIWSEEAAGTEVDLTLPAGIAYA